MAARSTIDDFEVLECLGHGTYGTVYRVVRRLDGQAYALKEIELEGMSEKEQQDCIQETRVLSSLSSPYIIKYYDSFLHDEKLCIVTEYASNGNLHDYIQCSRRKLPEDLVWKLFIQVLLGLHHMHSRKVLHRDIKTLNVFLDQDLNVKLGDMGVAKVLTSTCSFAQSLVGTPYYLSPELCEDRPYNYKSDVWALGVVLYECCTQKHPFDADNQGALILKILRGKYPPVAGYSPDLVDIVKRCLTQNVVQRPNTIRLLQLPCIRNKAAELGIALPGTCVRPSAAKGPAPAAVAPAVAAAAHGKRVVHAVTKSSPCLLRQGEPPGPTARGVRDAPAIGPSNRVRDRAGAGQVSRPLPSRPSRAPGQGVIRVVGNMDRPTARPLHLSPPTGIGGTSYLAAGVTLEPLVKPSTNTSTRPMPAAASPLVPLVPERGSTGMEGREATAASLSATLRSSPASASEPSSSAECEPLTRTVAAESLPDVAALPSMLSTSEFRPAGEGLRIRKLVGPDKAFVFGAGSASCGAIQVKVSGSEMTSGDHDDAPDDAAQASTWPLEAEWKLVSGNAEHAVASGSDDGSGNDEDAQGDGGDEAADVAEGYGSSSRQERIHLALMLHKEACVKALGQDTFLQLYSFLRSMHGDDAAIPAAMLRGHSNAMQLLCKLLYLEEQLDATE